MPHYCPMAFIAAENTLVTAWLMLGAAVATAIATRASMIAYSTVVTPFSSLRNIDNNCFMTSPLPLESKNRVEVLCSLHREQLHKLAQTRERQIHQQTTRISRRNRDATNEDREFKRPSLSETVLRRESMDSDSEWLFVPQRFNRTQDRSAIGRIEAEDQTGAD